jgi:DNA-binding NarL/FixJ family response regulator
VSAVGGGSERLSVVAGDATEASVEARADPVGATAVPTVLVIGFGGALGAGLREVIAQDGGLRMAEPDGEPDLETAIAGHRPDVVLINHDALRGVIELRRLVLAHPETRIVVGVMHVSRVRDDSMLAAGARVVLPITIEAPELCGALRLVGRRLVGAPGAGRGATAGGLGLLTEREAQVVELLVRRRRAREIAAALGVSVTTVNSHCRRIYEKLGVHSRAEVIEYVAALADPQEPEGRLVESTAEDRMPFRRRSHAALESVRPSVVDLRAARGARWLRDLR